MRSVNVLAASFGALVITHPVLADAIPGDPGRGAVVYERCAGCHSPDANRVGPRHRGVVGRRAGGVEDFAYSTGLRTAGFVWDAASLDQWLTDPGRMVPGSRMGFRLADPQARADVIAYLATLK